MKWLLLPLFLLVSPAYAATPTVFPSCSFTNTNWCTWTGLPGGHSHLLLVCDNLVSSVLNSEWHLQFGAGSWPGGYWYEAQVLSSNGMANSPIAVQNGPDMLLAPKGMVQNSWDSTVTADITPTLVKNGINVAFSTTFAANGSTYVVMGGGGWYTMQPTTVRIGNSSAPLASGTCTLQ